MKMIINNVTDIRACNFEIMHQSHEILLELLVLWPGLGLRILSLFPNLLGPEHLGNKTSQTQIIKALKVTTFLTLKTLPAMPPSTLLYLLYHL